MDEQYLIERSKKGDKSAFTTLIEMYQNRLFRTACGIVGNSSDAYDALQECILKAYLSLNSLKYDYYFKYWINRILINSCNDILRHRKKVVFIEDSNMDPQSDEYDIVSLDIKNALKKLEPKYRHILSLRYYQDLSYEDIAETLSCPVGTVKSRLNYALKKMREVIGKDGLMEVEK